MGIEQFTDIFVSFVKTADPQVVFAICICTYMIYRAFGLSHGYRHETLAVVSFFLSVPFTWAFSVSEEVAWGGRYIWSIIIRNGSVAVVAWLFIAPQVFKQWPQYLHPELTESQIEALKRAVEKQDTIIAGNAPSVEERAVVDEVKRTALK